MRIAIGLLLLLGGCAATAVQDVPMPDLGKEIADPAKGRLYIYRDSSFTEGHNELRLYAGRVQLGVIGNNHYLCVELPPRAYQIGMELERFGAPNTTGEEFVTVRPGKVKYLEVSFSTGSRWPKLREVPAPQGREAIADLDPAPLR